MIEVGIKGVQKEVVTEKNVASAVGNAGVDVFATPFLIALAEKTCLESIKSELEDGQSSVGSQINIKHMAATPIGMTVRCESELIEVEKSRLLFKVVAFDDEEQVMEGTHERFVIDMEKFFARVDKKAKNKA